MRSLLFAILVACLCAVPAGGAFYFGTSTQLVSVADNVALDLPNGEWTIALRGQETTRATSSRLYSRNRNDTANVIVFSLGTGGGINELYTEILSGSGADPGFPVSNATAITSGNPFTVIVSRGSDGFVRVYINNTLTSTSDNALTTSLDSAQPLILGNRDGGERPFDGWIADFAQWNRLLTASERAAYHAGFSATCFPQSLTVYMPMIRDYNEIKAGIAVTNESTTVVAHPRVIFCGQ